MNVYFVSGLGADRRAFQYLQIDSRLKVHYLDWISNKANETLESYAQRMAQEIDTSQPFCLLGLSFGGIVAAEIAKIYPPKKIVFLSTVKTKFELPWYYRVVGFLKLHQLVPLNYVLKSKKLIYTFFGVKSDKEKELLDGLIKTADLMLFKWSIDNIVRWKNETLFMDYKHIHGSDDLIFPIKYISNCKEIEGGTHLMVVKRFRIISDTINEYLLR